MKPALTAEEWGRGMYSACVFQHNFPLYVDGLYQPQNARKQAAILLHNQPFGFTREMVEALNRLVYLGSENAAFIDDPEYDGPIKDLAFRAIDNLEALLPPKGKR